MQALSTIEVASDLALELNACCDSIESAKGDVINSCKAILAKSLRVGEILITVKDALDHGQFGAWIKANCPFSHQMAVRYMDLSKLNRDLSLPPGMSARAAMLMHGIIPKQPHRPAQALPGGVSMYDALNAWNVYWGSVKSDPDKEPWRNDEEERQAMKLQYRPMKEWIDDLYAL